MKLLWLIQFAGNGVTMLLVWWWLGLPDATVAQVVLSAAAAVVIVAAYAWMQAATLAAFREPGGAPWRASLRRTPLVALWLVVLVAALWGESIALPPSRVWLRRAVYAATFLVLIPVGSRLASRAPGLARVYRDWRYYAAFAAAAVVGVSVPARLLAWVPEVEGLRNEALSFGARLLAAYVLAVASWMLLARMVGQASACGGLKPASTGVETHAVRD